MKWWTVAAGLALLLATACSISPSSAGGRSPTLIVAAAADLQFAFEEIGPLFQREKGVKVEFTFGSSGNLARQIENGAPIDVFASADEAYVDQLQGEGLILKDTRQLYALGYLVLASNRAAGLEADRLSDLLSAAIRHVAIANPDHAPYGRAARQALERAGIWDQVSPKLVYGENIRQTLQFVQTGNADAGVLALSVANVPEVKYTPVDRGLYDPLRQALAAVQGTRQEAAARQFIALVTGPEGRAVLQKYGFGLPSEP